MPHDGEEIKKKKVHDCQKYFFGLKNFEISLKIL
jgi:hypothetical protein